jgi:hypothetical protein
MWIVIIIMALLIGSSKGWFWGVLIMAGWLLCLHVRNLYVRRYM